MPSQILFLFPALLGEGVCTTEKVGEGIVNCKITRRFKTRLTFLFLVTCYFILDPWLLVLY